MSDFVIHLSVIGVLGKKEMKMDTLYVCINSVFVIVICNYIILQSTAELQLSKHFS